MKLKEIVDSYLTHDAFLQAVATKVLELADAQPDFLYAPTRGYTCSYNGPAIKVRAAAPHDYGPQCSGCILGQAMKAMGWNDETELLLNSTFNNLVFNKAGLGLTPLRSILNSVQGYQDDGNTWGMAVTELREYMSSLSANAPATEV